MDVTPSATMDNGCITLTERNYSDGFVRVPNMDEPSSFSDISVNSAGTTIVGDIPLVNVEENPSFSQFGNNSVPDTPEILETLLDFDSNPNDIKFDPFAVKEEIWDFLQGESNLDLGGYESGYDSSASPRSQITSASSPPCSPFSSFSDDFFENKIGLNDIFENIDFNNLLE